MDVYSVLYQHSSVALSVSVIAMFVAWLVFLINGNAGIVDVFWGLGIAGGAVTLFVISEPDPYKTVGTAMPVLWAMRLSGFLLLTRIFKKHKDKRYEALRSSWRSGVNVKFLGNFMLQAVLQQFVGLAFLFLSFASVLGDTSEGFGWLAWLMIGLFIVGLTGETVADKQLLAFKRSQPQGSKSVCDSGLWACSRHPNYFFEFLVWLSIAGFSATRLLSLDQPLLAFLSLLSPAAMLLIFLGITLPFTEKQSLASRGEAFAEYQRRVPKFLPSLSLLFRK